VDVLAACHQALVADLWGAVVSTFTAEHLERVRLTNIAIAEIVPDFTCWPSAALGGEHIAWPGNGRHPADRRRAALLARMQVNGPSHPVTCEAHHAPNRPDIWDECGKVDVASALLGRTCWKVQP